MSLQLSSWCLVVSRDVSSDSMHYSSFQFSYTNPFKAPAGKLLGSWKTKKKTLFTASSQFQFNFSWVNSERNKPAHELAKWTSKSSVESMLQNGKWSNEETPFHGITVYIIKFESVYIIKFESENE